MKNWKHIKTKEQLREAYASYVPALQKVAKQCGYSLAVHGSMERDLDLVAVPWVRKAMTPESLVIMLQRSLESYPHSRSWLKHNEGVTINLHGRKSYVIVFANLADDFQTYSLRHAYIDLSVMPLSK